MQNKLQEIKVPIDQFATPVYAGDIANCIQHILTNKEMGIFHVSGNDYYNRYQLVQKIVSYFPENNVLIEGIETKLFNQAAMRPLKGGLVNSKLYSISPNLSFTNIDSYLKKIIHGI
jgi:dTDP-4-dehydrorhamnose reductase